jgi:hypothetical protein
MLLQILKYIGYIATILAGLASLIWPLNVLSFTGLQVNGGRGITEVRTILGALFVGLGAAVLYFNTPQTDKVLGITYLSMAVTRAVSIVLDRSLVSSNVISVIVELVFGIVFIL